LAGHLRDQFNASLQCFEGSKSSPLHSTFRTSTRRVATSLMGQSTKSLRSSPLRGSKSRDLATAHQRHEPPATLLDGTSFSASCGTMGLSLAVLHGVEAALWAGAYLSLGDPSEQTARSRVQVAAKASRGNRCRDISLTTILPRLPAEGSRG
jgi:hypothetical protein